MVFVWFYSGGGAGSRWGVVLSESVGVFPIVPLQKRSVHLNIQVEIGRSLPKSIHMLQCSSYKVFLRTYIETDKFFPRRGLEPGFLSLRINVIITTLPNLKVFFMLYPMPENNWEFWRNNPLGGLNSIRVYKITVIILILIIIIMIIIIIKIIIIIIIIIIILSFHQCLGLIPVKTL